DEAALPIACHFPAIIDHNVLVSRGLHAARHHRVGSLPDQLGGYVTAEMIPTVPAHWRSARQAVIPWLVGSHQRKEQKCWQDVQRATEQHVQRNSTPCSPLHPTPSSSSSSSSSSSTCSPNQEDR